jgi:hypothetical protein
LFHIDHHIKFERNVDKFDYILDGVKHYYLPDFKMPDGTYVEIKAWMDERVRIKLASCPGVVILMQKEMTSFLQYAVDKYGKDFVRLYNGFKRPEKLRMCKDCGVLLSRFNKSGHCFKCSFKYRDYSKRSSYIRIKKEPRICLCKKCGRKIHHKTKSGLCVRCVRIGVGRKAARPSLDVLIGQTKQYGFSATGRMYGVSDNAIRKWLREVPVGDPLQV